MPRAIRLLPAVIIFGMIGSMTACSPDPCSQGLGPDEAVGSGGDAGLILRVVEPTGFAMGRHRTLGCVDVALFGSMDYADTLFSGRVLLEGESGVIRGLPSSTVDVIVDLPGYFPVKFVDRMLSPGSNRLDSRALLFPIDSAVTVPGWFSFSLKDGATLEDVAPVYEFTRGLTPHPTPEGWYEMEVPVERGVLKTRERVERLCRALVHSPMVRDARPMVALSTVMPGM